MKKMLALSLVMALALALFAVPIASGSPSANPTIGDKPKPAPEKKSPSATAPSASPAAATGDFVGRHTMTGQVTKIDPAKGTFSLKTQDAGTLDLHAPPSALAGVKKGDPLSVEIAVKPMR